MIQVVLLTSCMYYLPLLADCHLNLCPASQPFRRGAFFDGPIVDWQEWRGTDLQVTPLYTIWRSTRETIRRWVTKGSWCWVRKLRFGEIHNPLTYVFICVFKSRLFLKCTYIHMYYFHTYIYWCLNVYMHIDLIAQISPRSFPLTTLCYLAFYWFLATY